MNSTNTTENENENENIEGTNKFVLSKPLKDGDKLITEIQLDFESLTGQDLLNVDMMCTQYFANKGYADTSLVKELSKPYLTYVVAYAAKLPAEVIRQLSAKDFSKVTTQASHFLLS
ncbi:hypothetical protein D3C87_935600 [compost metagenome]